MRYKVTKTTTIMEVYELDRETAEEAQTAIENGEGTKMHNRNVGVRLEVRPSVRINLPRVDKTASSVQSGASSALQKLQET